MVFILVRVVGLEPTRLTAEEPKSSESTISTIPADMSGRVTCRYFILLWFLHGEGTEAERNAWSAIIKTGKPAFTEECPRRGWRKTFHQGDIT